MENSLKGLMLAAGTIITCLVVSLGFFISKEAQNTASGGANQIGKLNSEFMESDKSIYDGAVVSGSEVINAIKKFSKETVGICVETAKSTTYYNYVINEGTGELENKSTNNYSISLDKNSDYYINPYGNFLGSIVRDENDVITGLCFVQQ